MWSKHEFRADRWAYSPTSAAPQKRTTGDKDRRRYDMHNGDSTYLMEGLDAVEDGIHDQPPIERRQLPSMRKGHR